MKLLKMYPIFVYEIIEKQPIFFETILAMEEMKAIHTLATIEKQQE